MGKAIGIDLGTTNSVAAFKLAEVEVVTANDNTPPDRKLTRSVVAYEQGKFSVGDQAYNQLRADPENVVISIKRLMGRGFGDTAVQKQKLEIGYKIAQPSQGTDNSIAILLGNQEFQPEDISAEILKKVVQNTQVYRQGIGKTSEVIDQAVITIPAYFNDKQRHATRAAARKAGLVSSELLPEPTAAAISYGFSPDSEDVKTILVYDFGGGTFDASLITAAGTSFIEQGKAGDLWLGGDDIDSRIIKFVKERVAQQEGISDIESLIAKMPHYQRVRFNADLKIAVERAKVELSSSTVALIAPATQLLDELGIAIPIEVEITREQFEELITDFVDSSIQICRQALQYAEYHLDMVDVVLLVGGSSQIPLVQRKVQQTFGIKKVVVHPRPMYAVAEGAAIVAAGLTEKVGTVSRDYFIQLADGAFKVISQGDILPVTTSHTFKTVAEGQRLIHFQLFSPDEVKENRDGGKYDEVIGDIWLGLDNKYPAGTEILVNLELDEQNSPLQMRATLKNDPAVSISCTFSRGKSDEGIYRELEEAIAELNNQGLTDIGVEAALKLAVPVVQLTNEIVDLKTGEERLDFRERARANLKKFQVSMSSERLEAESLVNQCDRMVELCSFMIPQPQVERLQKLSQELQNAINANDLSKMEFESENARRELRNLPEEVQLIQAIIISIRQARAVAPTQANAMSEKLFQMLNAIEKGDGGEAERLWGELQPDVEYWLDQELPSNTIVTGLKR
ncbi:Hsp70 family protein [Nodularia sphaerocarpa]|uniref:Hsp70 family protein n=1 Tax=Nodularia sphaerocarpa TaxID=137816 RepID=UPI001EFB654E|nr:Hsp70 family protein [Nodularia sphaerocarpa]MDB9372011.1 Hsp70 family protein [Nodularia sphaerocarpa CS-585]MDB9379483.1 Hsp70 family protein [Nodularia sphaerocarpa CS-585A2]ULP73572.1 Chaperone protein DnaK [Nodularia sphaerocarpa UHCC 0038]